MIQQYYIAKVYTILEYCKFFSSFPTPGPSLDTSICNSRRSGRGEVITPSRKVIATSDKFSVDLDFDLTAPDKESFVYQKVKEIVLKHGVIFDEAPKHHGPIIVLDYGVGERKLKIEISNRQFGSLYEVKDFLGISVRVMVLPDMFAHKLCALTDRKVLTNRDIFDCWFFLSRKTPVSREIVEARTGLPLESYLGACISTLENLKHRKLLNGLGELTDEKTKQFVRTGLLQETIQLLRLFQRFPLEALGD